MINGQAVGVAGLSNRVPTEALLLEIIGAATAVAPRAACRRAWPRPGPPAAGGGDGQVAAVHHRRPGSPGPGTDPGPGQAAHPIARHHEPARCAPRPRHRHQQQAVASNTTGLLAVAGELGGERDRVRAAVLGSRTRWRRRPGAPAVCEPCVRRVSCGGARRFSGSAGPGRSDGTVTRCGGALTGPRHAHRLVVLFLAAAPVLAFGGGSTGLGQGAGPPQVLERPIQRSAPTVIPHAAESRPCVTARPGHSIVRTDDVHPRWVMPCSALNG
jgi:hypothetical protein